MTRNPNSDAPDSITQSKHPATDPRDAIEPDPVKPESASPLTAVEPLQPPAPTRTGPDAPSTGESQAPNPAVWAEHED